MSLFIGNISRSISSSDLEKLFQDFGPCRINFKGSYAFAEYDEERDADEAIEQLQAKNMGGRQLNLEWSKKSKRFDPSKTQRRRRSISPRKSDARCYNCGHRGHFMRECTKRRRRSYSRSRSNSKSNRRHRRRSRSKSYSRSRSRQHRKRSESSKKSPHKKQSESRKRSKSPSNKSHSKSHSSKSRKSSKQEDRSPVNIEQEFEKKPVIIEQPKVEEPEQVPVVKEEVADHQNGNLNENKEVKEEEVGEQLTKNETNNNVDNENLEFDYNKLKVDELKNKLKEKGVTFGKTARKGDLIDLLKNNS